MHGMRYQDPSCLRYIDILPSAIYSVVKLIEDVLPFFLLSSILVYAYKITQLRSHDLRSLALIQIILEIPANSLSGNEL